MRHIFWFCQGSSLWIYDLVRQLHTQFTFSGGFIANPTWSPDGSQLAFATTRTGPFNMYLKPANGAAEEKAIHPSPDDERPQSWSPDGKYLVYERRPTSRQGVAEIMILPLVGEQKPYSLLNAPYANWGAGLAGRPLDCLRFRTRREETKSTSALFPKSGVRGRFLRQAGEHPAGSAMDGPFTMRVLTEC